MCGIAGIIGSLPDSRDAMIAMLNRQKHRGPDATGSWFSDACTLGHNRLSIIDLSTEANQPMHSDCGRYVLVFNGEIYNYRELKAELTDYPFHTRSDSEVLVALYKKYGKEMLDRLNGMFAFAIWDTLEKKLFAARDRFGVKPFYYTFLHNSFLFASEIKTLWAAGVDKQPNDAVWAGYFVYGSYRQPHETFWDSISQLPAGHYIEYSNAETSVTPKRWYNFVERIHNTPQLPEAQLKETYTTMLNDSIKLRFRADVPVGFNISGGLDSSTLLALVNQQFPQSRSIEAFTFYCNDERYDELPWVEKMISKSGNTLNACLLKVEDVEALMREVSYYQDEPFGGFPTLAYSLIFKEARRKGILVLLDGQGMDEAWAGYDYYRNRSGFTIQGTTASPFRPGVIKEEYRKLAVKEEYPEPFADPLQNLQYRDLFHTKIPRALRFNDRISMMHSTELREPFLDYRLVELAFAQPVAVKIHEGQSKWLLRQLVKEMLGDDIALAPKRALQTPQREWLAGELKEWMKHKVQSIAQHEFFEPKALNEELNQYLSGSQDSSFHIFQYLSYSMFTNEPLAC